MDTKHYQTHTLVDVAYKALKKDIVERALLPGQKLIIRELHERYGISGTPIKQALNRLITEGLVENTPRKGIKVRDLQWEEVEEILDIRLMIETYYVKKIIENFNKNEDIKEKLRKNLSEHMRVVEEGAGINDFFLNYYLDQEFHKIFVECSGNISITDIYNNLGTHIYSHYIYGRQGIAETIAGVKEHEAILNALAAGDEANLCNAIEVHIINAKNKINKNFTNRKEM